MRPSVLLGLEGEGETTMLDFDFLCTYRLDLYDYDCRKQGAQRVAMEAMSAWTGQPLVD